MSKRLRTILIGAVGVIVVLLAGLFSGALDSVLRQLNVQIAGRPVPVAETVASTDVVATPAPAKADADSASATPAAETVVPIFDLVRVEPTGDAVIAGRSDPDAKVEILSGKDVVAGGKANDTGSWAIVLADPLKPGAHDLSVRVTGKDGKVATSEQSVAVSVPEGGNGDVLVVLNQPGSPSTVLQVPGLEEAQAKLADAGVDPAQAAEAATTVVAEASPTPAAVPAAEPPVSASATATATAGNETTPATTAEPAAAVVTTEPVAAPAVAATPAAVDIPAPPADMLAAAATPALAPSASQAAPAEPEAEKPAPAPAATAPAVPAADNAASPAAAPAAAPAEEAPAAAPATTPAAPAVAEPADEPKVDAAAAPAPTVSIDAVELENGNRFFAAGAAGGDAVIRLYVDDKLVGDTKADKGRWLYQGELKLAPGKHLVRIDQVDDKGEVLARAEVPFQIADDGLSAPTLASGVGSAQAGAGSAGEAKPAEPATLIIRRGDNLWMIAKRLYGKGVRYSTIYQANTDQIRNPDLIYPGQVFVIPEGDSAWKPVGQ